MNTEFFFAIFFFPSPSHNFQATDVFKRNKTLCLKTSILIKIHVRLKMSRLDSVQQMQKRENIVQCTFDGYMVPRISKLTSIILYDGGAQRNQQNRLYLTFVHGVVYSSTGATFNVQPQTNSTAASSGKQ